EGGLALNLIVLGILVAAAGLLIAEWTGDPHWDGVASMTIGVMLCLTAWILAVETKGLLVGESATREVRSAIRAAALSVGEVDTVERLLTMHLGPDEILVNMDLTVEPGKSAADLEALTGRIEAAVVAVVPQATRIFVEYGSGQ
ncbi:MAG: cation transporter, partial [Acidimicrobiia bacterium]|nr:cation transporter [Acidimicrobiia bacterium]